MNLLHMFQLLALTLPSTLSLTDSHCISSDYSLLQENVRESHTAKDASIF